MGLTHFGDVMTHVFVEKPADGVRAIGRVFTGKTRSQRRAERAKRLVEHRQAKTAARLVAEAEAKRLAQDAALRRAKLAMETGQQMAAAAAEELNRMKAEEVLAEPTTDITSVKDNNGAKSSDDPAPAPKVEAKPRSRAKSAPAPERVPEAGDVVTAD